MDTTDFLIYDFPAHIGDTASIQGYQTHIWELVSGKTTLENRFKFQDTKTYYYDYGLGPSSIMGIGGEGWGHCERWELHCFNDLNPDGIKYNQKDSIYQRPVSRDELEEVSNFILSPNPAFEGESIKINGLTAFQAADILIYNQIGQLVYQTSSRTDLNGKLSFQLKLPSGVYILKLLNQNKETYNEKLLVY